MDAALICEIGRALADGVAVETDTASDLAGRGPVVREDVVLDRATLGRPPAREVDLALGGMGCFRICGAASWAE